MEWRLKRLVSVLQKSAYGAVENAAQAVIRENLTLAEELGDDDEAVDALYL